MARLLTAEDSFVERKSLGDWKKDAVETCVAFANSCSIDGAPGLLCIGVKDDGAIESANDVNLDTLQKTFESRLQDAYPPIHHETRVIEVGNRAFIAVIVPGSAEGPHFAGSAWVRTGPQNTRANAEQFERIIDRRERKIREILKWKNKTVKLARVWARPSIAGRIAGFSDVVVLDCDSVVVKLASPSGGPFYLALEHIVLGRDSQSGCLVIEAPQD